jgi:hypothetical protein
VSAVKKRERKRTKKHTSGNKRRAQLGENHMPVLLLAIGGKYEFGKVFFNLHKWESTLEVLVQRHEGQPALVEPRIFRGRPARISHVVEAHRWDLHCARKPLDARSEELFAGEVVGSFAWWTGRRLGT